MDQVRLGVIGCGGMAQSHMAYFDKVPGLKFAAASDVDPAILADVTKKYGVKGFDDGLALIESGEVDAILIATPHYFHPTYAIAGFEHGLHVLSEKPVAVTAKAAQQVNEQAAKHPELIYAAMFNQRTAAHYRQVKKLLDAGRVGELVRVSWTITTWFRTQSYYNSGGWRATWKGEGGGVLINQCPHNLDLFQWFVGLPSRVTAKVGIGKYHHIEVEDDVTALLEFENGATGTFITSTGQSPGVNRLEIVGDRGTIISENGQKLEFLETEASVRTFCEQSPERFANPGVVRHTIETHDSKTQSQHQAITVNFINAILHGEPLVASGTEGIRGLELGNAMLMSGLTGKPVEIPTPRDEFADLIDDLIKNSTFKKQAPKKKAAPADLAGSF